MSVNQHSFMSLYIEMYFNETLLSSGTAFLANKDNRIFLITNRHNVTGRHQNTNAPLSKTGGLPNKIRVQRFNSASSWIAIDCPLFDTEDNPLWYEHPRLAHTADFIALEVENAGDIAKYQHVYDLNPPNPELLLTPSDTVSVIGFPFGHSAGGYFPIWVSGFLASEMVNEYNGLPQFLVDCRTRQGQSGSPVVAYRNGFARLKNGQSRMGAPISQFLGIYSGRINNESDIGIVWKSEAIKELIDAI